MNAKLIGGDYLRGSEEITVSQWPATIGRGPDASVRLDDLWVSRRHCKIDEVDGKLIVQDLGSKHGTWVNGRRVTESPLLPGDELNIGLEKFYADYETSELAEHD